MKKKITDEEIFKRIAVRKPYFALKELTINDDHVVKAVIPVEQSLEMESPPIAAAEASRHLAILGSCAVALTCSTNNQMNFYLAHKATLRRIQRDTSTTNIKKMYGFAKGKLIDERNAIARTELRTDNNEVIYLLNVKYYVVREKAFDKLYNLFKETVKNIQKETLYPSNHKNLLKNQEENPYKAIFPFYDYSLSANAAKMSLGIIKNEYCLGHFPFYPTLPVAHLAYQEAYIAGLLLKNIIKKENIKYSVKKAFLSVEKLAFAGEKVDINTAYIGSRGKDYLFHCEAITNNGKQVGNLKLTLRLK